VQDEEAEVIRGYKASFASGELTGIPVNETICLGGSLCAKLEIMAAVKESDYPFVEMPFDGILGLGLKDDSPIKFLQKSSGISVFAFHFGKPSCDIAGQAAFGHLEDLPPWVSRERLMWAPLMPKAEEEGFWLLELVSVSVGGHLIQTCGTTNPCRAVVDTGAGDVMAPQDLVDPLLDILQVATKECNLNALPKIELQMQGVERIFTLTLDPSDYMAMDDCRPQFSSIEMPDAKPLWVLGVPVLRKYVSVYDLSKRRVGFAEPGKGSRKRRAVRGMRFL